MVAAVKAFSRYTRKMTKKPIATNALPAITPASGTTDQPQR
jgi:hypothetical protein